MNTSYKSDYLSLFKTAIFPQSLIQKDCLRHKELLFSDFPVKPDLLLKQNLKSLGDCFIPALKKNEEQVDDQSVKKTLSNDNFNNKAENQGKQSSKTPKAGSAIGWKRGDDKEKPKENTLRALNFVDTTDSNLSSKTPTGGGISNLNMNNPNIFKSHSMGVDEGNVVKGNNYI